MPLSDPLLVCVPYWLLSIMRNAQIDPTCPKIYVTHGCHKEQNCTQVSSRVGVRKLSFSQIVVLIYLACHLPCLKVVFQVGQ